MDGGQEAFLSAEVRLLTRRLTVSGRTAVQTVLPIFHDQAVHTYVCGMCVNVSESRVRGYRGCMYVVGFGLFY